MLLHSFYEFQCEIKNQKQYKKTASSQSIDLCKFHDVCTVAESARLMQLFIMLWVWCIISNLQACVLNDYK